MNQRRISWGFSQLLAALVVALAILMMMAPFRGGNRMTQMRTAGVLPVLSTASIAHGVSFQAFHSSERVCVSEVPLFRSAIAAKNLQRRQIVVRKSAGPKPGQFQTPRTQWRHLDRATRERLDSLAASWSGDTIELRSTGLRTSGLRDLERLSRSLLSAGLSGGAMVIGNGAGSRDGAVAVRDGAPTAELPLTIYLAGDFHWQAPTSAQWEALDEVMDYLELKCGRIDVQIAGADALDSARATLGPLFPTESLLRALSAPKA